jgi:stearoyl-CoA desaturase (delta-9 desaturase)
VSQSPEETAVLAVDASILRELDILPGPVGLAPAVAVPAGRHAAPIPHPAANPTSDATTAPSEADLAALTAEAALRQAPLAVRLATATAVIVPPLALVGAMILAWGGYFGWLYVGLLVGMYIISGLGITIGYHRLYTHKSFATRGPVAVLFAIFGGMATQGPVIWWCATHRKHHQHSDHEHDPHSPHAGHGPGVRGAVKGFLHAHMGWLFEDLRADMKRYVPDLLADRTTIRINQLFPLWVALGLLIPAAIGGLVTMSWMGAFLGFLWGGIVRICVLHHVTWSINSVCHIWGSRDYASGDESRNNPIFGILAFGEGWHNNHHAFPASARHGLKWWQFDSSWVIIRTLEKLGLASKIRLPAPDRLAAKSTRTRDAKAA